MAFGDLLRINTNSQSLQAQFQLNKINRQIALSQLRLATGLRIVKAEDDAAGFSIAAKLTSRIASLEQALRNAGDAKSVLDIAEKNLDTSMDILTMIKVKATQAANDTYGDEERTFIQQQITALLGELDALHSQAVFQGRNLLNGSYNATFQVGSRTADVINVQINSGTAGQGFSSAELNLGAIDVSNNLNAQEAMNLVDQAITSVASAVNRLGIAQMRLSLREESLSRTIISNSAVKSRIMDVDFAREASNLLRLQILQQTAIFALTQANLAPRVVLSLF